MHPVSFGSSYKIEPFVIESRKTYNPEVHRRIKFKNFVYENEFDFQPQREQTGEKAVVFNDKVVVPADKDEFFESYCVQNNISFSKISNN